MGPWTRELLARLGIKGPLFVQRGYHMHYSVENEAKLNHWVVDAEKGFLLEPMRAGIRRTTGELFAQIVDGEAKAVDMAPFRVDRF
ncbi:hypothetical protein [Salinicola endophyticus]|uniref:hypothetical protein n=1 Tax=Salinicola endophyticus TaxID=1949083 RepID=UPI00249A1838|nr:hypothetical protein [Salinicola endophyticus]